MANSRKAGPDPGDAVAACLRAHLPGGGPVTVGYSGGLDSTVLLHALWVHSRSHGAYQVAALHLHHGLSPRADQWVAHAEAFCRRLDIPLKVVRARVVPMGDGLEAAARKVRYQAFRAAEAAAVLLAHHRDDQAETVLLQLRRGGGVRGLAAMPRARRLTPDTWLLRPFLELPRTRLLAYAQRHGLDWVEDDSNLDLDLDRNRLRHALLPRLDAALPGMSEALARVGGQAAEWADLLDSLAATDAGDALTADGVALECLRRLPEPRARNVLRLFLERAGAPIRQASLVEATRQARGAGPGTQARVDFGIHSLVCFAGWARLVPSAVHEPAPWRNVPWHGETELDLGPGGRLVLRPGEGGVALGPGPVLVRRRMPGDRVSLPQSGRHRVLKDVLRERGIPPWRRPWLPLVEVDGAIAWVADLGVQAGHEARQGAPGWIISWAPPW